MAYARRTSGEFHGRSRLQRRVAGFIITECWYSAGLLIPPHDHELASVTVVLDGGYEEHFGRSARRAGPGSIIVHPSGEKHRELHDPIPTTLLTIELEPSPSDHRSGELSLFADPSHRTSFAVAAACHRLRMELEHDDLGSTMVVESAMADLISYLTGHFRVERGCPRWLEHVRDRLEAEYATPPTLAELAGSSGVHPVYLARAFRKRFRQSVGEYVRRAQVGRAIFELSLGGSLVAAAHSAGFSDQSHMTRVMRSVTGKTPGQWRKRDDGG